MRPFFIGAAIAIFAAGLNAVAAPAGNVASCIDCGTVQSIQPVATEPGSRGAVVVGGVAGHEIGKRNAAPQTVYKVTVAMDGGGTREVNVGELSGLSAGQKVRVSGENLEKL